MPEVDKLLEEARSSTDEAVRKAAYAALEDILQDESPNAPLFYSTLNAAASKGLSGFVMDPAGYHKLENVVVE